MAAVYTEAVSVASNSRDFMLLKDQHRESLSPRARVPVTVTVAVAASVPTLTSTSNTSSSVFEKKNENSKVNGKNGNVTGLLPLSNQRLVMREQQEQQEHSNDKHIGSSNGNSIDVKNDNDAMPSLANSNQGPNDHDAMNSPATATATATATAIATSKTTPNSKNLKERPVPSSSSKTNTKINTKFRSKSRTYSRRDLGFTLKLLRQREREKRHSNLHRRRRQKHRHSLTNTNGTTNTNKAIISSSSESTLSTGSLSLSPLSSSSLSQSHSYLYSLPPVSHCLWATSYQANDPSEDRYASLTNVLLQPNTAAATNTATVTATATNHILRMSLFAVMDGHGGPAVAEYASKKLLPLLVKNISSRLSHEIMDMGLFKVNGRTKADYDLDGSGSSTNTSTNTSGNGHSRANAGVVIGNEDECEFDKEEDHDCEHDEDVSDASDSEDEEQDQKDHDRNDDDEEEDTIVNERWYKAPDVIDTTPSTSSSNATSSSANSKSGTQQLNFTPGTHSPEEQKFMTQIIQESFLELDENWMNAIDPTATRQTFLVHNGKWNSGACCLVNLVLQRFDADLDVHKDADADVNTDADADTDVDIPSTIGDCDAKEEQSEHASKSNKSRTNPKNKHKAILYSIHTGDCRAVLLSAESESDQDEDQEHNNDYGSNTSDELSFSTSTSSKNCAGSNSDEDDDDTAEDENEQPFHHTIQGRNAVVDDHYSYNGIMGRKRMLLNPFNSCGRPSFKRRRLWNGNTTNDATDLNNGSMSTPTSGHGRVMIESLTHSLVHRRSRGYPNHGIRPSPSSSIVHDAPSCSSSSSSSSLNDSTKSYPRKLPRSLQPITLTQDHTPYNQKEAALVRERCNYAPRAIASSSSGGIQRVAGSLSVTRALGDAYLKTPTLSFAPYKDHAPYISALPEVSARILTGGDRVLILASDGVWERVNEDKITKWIGRYCRQKDDDVRNGRISPLSADGNVSASASASACGSAASGNRRSVPGRTLSRRMRMLPTRKSHSTEEQDVINSKILNETLVSDMIVSKVLNRVRKKHEMSTLRDLMSLPKGHSTRTKHDDITTVVVDLKGFIM